MKWALEYFKFTLRDARREPSWTIFESHFCEGQRSRIIRLKREA
ncbi:hypothetical protein HanIR_Chr03g0114911 [Helianthus annuus]|nr:hypothetical protein HanIR_Chr03g0114911 [Helianthus annuus]